MKKFRLVMKMNLVCILAIVFMNFTPHPFPGGHNAGNPILGYIILASVMGGLMYKMELGTVKYLGFPRLHINTAFALIIVTGLIWSRVHVDQFASKGLGDGLLGIAFILSVGLGEEFVSRGFCYGVLLQHGKKYAVFFSSLIFGAMHLSWYLGKYWDPWMAYWHVTSAFAFGFFAACLMVVTRSIWTGVVFHGLMDWALAFDPTLKLLGDPDKVTHSAFWPGLFNPLPELFFFVACGVAFLYLDRGTWPKAFGKLEPIFIRAKLIERS
jgi:membrane protease YdiL (CAAX protease family)